MYKEKTNHTNVMCRANKWSQQVGFEQINCIYPRGYIVRRKQMLNRCQMFVSTIRYGSNNWVVTKSGFGIYIYAQISNNRQHQNSDMLGLILNADDGYIYIFQFHVAYLLIARHSTNVHF